MRAAAIALGTLREIERTIPTRLDPHDPAGGVHGLGIGTEID